MTKQISSAILIQNEDKKSGKELIMLTKDMQPKFNSFNQTVFHSDYGCFQMRNYWDEHYSAGKLAYHSRRSRIPD